MAQRFTASRRTGGSILPLVGIVAVALIGGTLLLHASGVVEIPLLSGDDAPPPAPDRTGKVRVVTCVRPIEAYARVEVAHIVNPKTGKIQYTWMRPNEIPEGAPREPRDVLGRVLKWDKPFGQIFLETEFYPVGTRPGPAAGVPPGKRAVRLAASDVPGLHGLRQGDHFDLVMTVEVEVEEPNRRTRRRHERLEVGGPWAPLHAAANAEAKESPYIVRRRADVRVVVRDGIVVKPVHQRKEVKKEASLFKGPQLNAVPIEELIIAVRPDEVAALTQALALEAHLQVAIRTGQSCDSPEADAAEIPDLEVEMGDIRPEMAEDEEGPDSSVRLVEVIQGGEKRLVAIPAADAGGTPSPEEDR